MEAVADTREGGGVKEGARPPIIFTEAYFKKWKHKKVFISISGIITYYSVQFRYII